MLVRSLICLTLLAGVSLAETLELKNDYLTVTLDDAAPRIVSIAHKASGIAIAGPGKLAADWEIEVPNGRVKLSQCDVSARVEDGKARYTIDTKRGVKFDMVFSLPLDKSEVQTDVENIAGDLRKVLFNDEPLVTVGAEAGPWMLAAANMMDGGRLDDALKAAPKRTADWVVLSNGKLAVSIQTTLWRYPNVIRREQGLCGIGPNLWHYGLKDGNHSDVYHAVIGIVGDLNADGSADWQDGCIFLQGHIPGPIQEMPNLVHETILGWVGIEDAGGNNGINATFPQVGDIIRRTYNITAGEPTMMGLAGWCYWGWDSEYPAADEASRRSGGNAGLVALCKDAWRYSSKISLCINHDDAYKHSPGWTDEIMCTNRDGSPHVYMYWSGGLAYHICPYKDWTTGQVTKRIDTMFDYGTGGSCYIDVLSAALDKHSEGPGGSIDWMDNLWAKFNIADYYWTNGLKLYSEHCKYPFVGRILGGLNNNETGLDSADTKKIPMPVFILHGRMNNFFSATRYGRPGRLLLGIVPNISGHVGSPVDEHLDDIFGLALVARTYVNLKMLSLGFDGKSWRAEYGQGYEGEKRDTFVTMGADGSRCEVYLAGVKIADQDSMFVPRAAGSQWAYSTKTQGIRYPVPPGWDANTIRVFVLNREGRHEEVFGVHRVEDGQITLKMFARVPYLVTDNQDLVPVGSEDYGRVKRTLVPVTAWPAPDTSIRTPAGVWSIRGTHADRAIYRDKRNRPKDTLVLTGSDGQVVKQVPVLGPAHGLAYDADRNQVIVGTGAFNYDGVQFVDAEAGKVVGLLPLVPEVWGDNLELAISGNILYVAAPNTLNVAAISLKAPWPKEAQQWCARVFAKGADPRDPEAALDEFLRTRWDRLRAVHQLGVRPVAIRAARQGGVEIRAAGGDNSEYFEITLSPAEGKWKAEAENGDFREPFDRLKRALELPRERIVATSLPGNAQPWWLTLPTEKHNIVPEPQPAGARLYVNVGPRYASADEAKRHAALIVALKTHNWLQDATTMPLVNMGEARKVDRSKLRGRYDFWMVGKMYGMDIITPEWIMALPTCKWYVETLAMPDGKTMYRAGLSVEVPTAKVAEVFDAALDGEAKWYAAAAEKATGSDKQRMEAFAKLFRDAKAEMKIDWLAP